MNYKFLFLVTSSIIPFQVGSVHSPQERFEQTLETVQSIRKQVPNAYVWIVESSSEELPEELKNQLIEVSDRFTENYDDEVLQLLYENLNNCPEKFDFGKSLLETRSLLLTFHELYKNNLFSDASRIFKLSGRYTLNENFCISDYESRLIDDYYVFQVSEFPGDIYDQLYGVSGQVTTGLWSFSRFLILDVIELYQKCFSYMDTMMSYTGGIDIEHSIYKHIDFSKVIRVPTLNVTRNHGKTGEIYNI